MNSRQLQYAILLSQVGNFSQVAESLDISQPALSKQILNLEKEIGVKLFDRNCVPVQLTPAGEYFIREAQELLYKEDQLLRSMDRYKTGEAGQLTIGITPFRGSYLIPEIVKSVRSKYPGIMVKLHEAGSGILRKEAAEGKFDFAVVNLPVDETTLDVIPLESDRLVLAVHKELLSSLNLSAGQKEIHFASCRELPFVVVGQSQEMRRLFDQLCAIAGFIPNIAAEVVSLTTAWAMACAGVAATVLPLQFVDQKVKEDVCIFEIEGATYNRQPAVVTRKGQYISDAAQYAIDVLSSGFTEKN